jgi:hypothetical protein
VEKTAMIDHLKHDQKTLMFWIGHAQKARLVGQTARMGWALMLTANMLRRLRTEDVSTLDFLLLCEENDAAMHAYWDEAHEREYSDRIWDCYMQVREWIRQNQRLGLVERDEDGNYCLSDAGRDYYYGKSA